jgi:hypothetical protein
MSTQDQISQTLPLNGMELPAEIGWWPLAYGWWVLLSLGLVLLVLTILLLKRWLHRRKQDPRHLALLELAAIEQSAHLTQLMPRQIALACNVLMKRVAMSLYPREQVAALSGNAWLEFLIAHSEKSHANELHQLISSLYQPPKEAEFDPTIVTQYVNLTRVWIKSAKERWQGV